MPRGRVRSVSAAALPGKRRRASASAANAPPTPATRLVAAATSKLVRAASTNSRLSRNAAYQRRLSPAGGKSIASPAVNEPSTTTRIGSTSATSSSTP